MMVQRAWLMLCTHCWPRHVQLQQRQQHMARSTTLCISPTTLLFMLCMLRLLQLMRHILPHCCCCCAWLL
jgi:hypothetical protein